MKNAEKKFVMDEIMSIASQIENGLSKEGAVAKLWQLANELRNELKEDAAR